VLFVEDTIFFIFESNTTKKIGRRMTIIAVVNIFTSFPTPTKKGSMVSFVRSQSFINEYG